MENVVGPASSGLGGVGIAVAAGCPDDAGVPVPIPVPKPVPKPVAELPAPDAGGGPVGPVVAGALGVLLSTELGAGLLLVPKAELAPVLELLAGAAPLVLS